MEWQPPAASEPLNPKRSDELNATANNNNNNRLFF